MNNDYITYGFDLSRFILAEHLVAAPVMAGTVTKTIARIISVKQA